MGLSSDARQYLTFQSALTIKNKSIITNPSHLISHLRTQTHILSYWFDVSKPAQNVSFGVLKVIDICNGRAFSQQSEVGTKDGATKHKAPLRAPLELVPFTGKERDEETGYGYFGARYMDHELMTMWLSVDPMSDKYPSISPYAYCAWNPVKLVDPDGRDWYKTEDGKMHYTVKYTSKEKFQNSGIKGEYLGKTTTVGSKYYSLFGQELDKNSKNGQITMKIDDAMMKYKEYGIAYDIYLKSSSCWDPEPSHSYTDLTISSVRYTHGSKNIHGPNEMGTYAGMADIYYYVNGSEKFMQGRLESWSPTTCVSGRNGNGTSPSRRGTDGKLIRSYITLRNENSINGVILGLNFHSEQMLANFKKKLDALYK